MGAETPSNGECIILGAESTTTEITCRSHFRVFVLYKTSEEAYGLHRYINAYPNTIIIQEPLRGIEIWGALLWRLNGLDGFSNHRRIVCLLNCLLRRRSKKTSKLRLSGLCEGNSPVTGEFPAQRASDAEIFPFDDVIMYSVNSKRDLQHSTVAVVLYIMSHHKTPD